jgi:hypothetical protein
MKGQRILISVLFLTSLLVAGVVVWSYAQEIGPPGGSARASAVGTTFTYQGQLKSGGAPVDDTCDFQFGLYDAASLGTQIGISQTESLTITNGLFTVMLNEGGQFGPNAFGGDARWLEIGVKCTGEISYTNLGRQALTAAPYALYAREADILDGQHAEAFWNIGGNAGTDPATHFLGTTDGQPLVMRTNGVEALRIDADGDVGIGVTDPGSYRLWISAGSDNGIRVESNGTYGIYAQGDSSAVYGQSTDGNGVYGESTTHDGVAGRSTDGEGVDGRSVNDDGVFGRSVTNDGVYGYSEHDDGVYGRSCSGAFPAGASCRGVYGRGSKGVEGHGWSWAFYAADGDYGPFTGAHEVTLAADFPQDAEPGMIVSVTGETRIRQTDAGEISFSSTLPTVQLSTTPNDSTVFGVFILESPLGAEHWYAAEVQDGDRFGIVNALGEGRVWASNVNGDIHAGDYVTTSPIAGHGQRQDDDLLHSYTLGKAIEEVDWSQVIETIEFGGRTYKVYPLAVVYTSG